ncbi:hypothetical protein, partial [Paracraurococcus ruber]
MLRHAPRLSPLPSGVARMPAAAPSGVGPFRIGGPREAATIGRTVAERPRRGDGPDATRIGHASAAGRQVPVLLLAVARGRR